MTPEAWKFAEMVLTLLVVPVTMFLLNKSQTAKLTAGQEEIRKDAVQAAKEVKADLEVAKIELKADAAVAQVKLEAVHQVAANTEKLANGDRAAKEQEIKRLRKSMRDKGYDPDEAK